VFCLPSIQAGGGTGLLTSALSKKSSKNLRFSAQEKDAVFSFGCPTVRLAPCFSEKSETRADR
jgi:hypothetical protein